MKHKTFFVQQLARVVETQNQYYQQGWRLAVQSRNIQQLARVVETDNES